MIKYIGSKRLLTPLIQRVAAMLPVRTACDLFAGTTRVGQALREAGIEVLSNDTASYSEVFGHAYIEAGGDLDRDQIRETIAHLGTLLPGGGYVTRVFCEQARYFHPDNGMRIDAIREEIDRLALDRLERSVLLTSLIEAADRVDSTVGLQMAYLKQWAPRALRPLELREPRAVPGPAGRAVRGDANELAAALDGVDLAYLDPPYNQHSYFRNYHVWETLVRNDRPGHYGVACKRQDARDVVSRFNSRPAAWPALRALIEQLPTPWILLSFSDEGFHDLATSTSCSASGGTWPRSAWTRSATWAPRSASTTRVASAPARFPTRATRRCCSCAGRAGPWSTGWPPTSRRPRFAWRCSRPGTRLVRPASDRQ